MRRAFTPLASSLSAANFPATSFSLVSSLPSCLASTSSHVRTAPPRGVKLLAARALPTRSSSIFFPSKTVVCLLNFQHVRTFTAAAADGKKPPEKKPADGGKKAADGKKAEKASEKSAGAEFKEKGDSEKNEISDKKAARLLRKRNLFSVIASLPVPENYNPKDRSTWVNKNGWGLRFARKIWKTRYPEPCYWTITRFKPKDKHGHIAKAWGILTWRGKPSHKVQRVRGSRKREWEIFGVQAASEGVNPFLKGPDPKEEKKAIMKQIRARRAEIHAQVVKMWEEKKQALEARKAKEQDILKKEAEETKLAAEAATRRVQEGQRRMLELEQERRASQSVARMSEKSSNHV